MKVIAHRGNTSGPSKLENQPSHIMSAIDKGFDVEIDVWHIAGHLWAGHDSAQYLLTDSFIKEVKDRAWFHCKNLEAMQFLSQWGSPLIYFWHESDAYTLTSSGHIWTYPGKDLIDKSICVMPESADISPDSIVGCFGVCTDYPGDFIAC